MIQTNGLIFVENPRCASTAISKTLLTAPGSMRLTPRHEPLPEPADILTFCVVRHPVDRFRSMYNYDGLKGETFLQWFGKNHFYQRVSQTYWTEHCDFILKFEDLPNDFNHIMETLGHPYRLRKNTTRPYPKLKPNEVEEIEKAVPEDFTTFGYSFTQTNKELEGGYSEETV